MTDTRPGWLVSKQVEVDPVQTLVVDGSQYEFTLVQAGVEPSLPYVVGYNDGILFISEEVKLAYRRHILTHEVREETTYREFPRQVRCLKSLLTELRDVGLDLDIDFMSYVTERSRFFDALVLFYEERPDQQAAREPGFLESIKMSQVHLRRLTA